MRVAWLLRIGASALVVILILGFGPATAVGVTLLILAAIVVLLRPRLLIYATFVLAFLTLPTAVPTTVSIGPFSFRAYEFTLALSAVYVLVSVKTTRAANVLAWLLGLLVMGGALLGVARQNPMGDILTDVRWLAIMWLGFIVASRVVRTPAATILLRLLPWVLWVSAAFVLAGSLFGLPLTGRTEQASLSNIGDLNEATRLLTPTNFLALAVVAGIIALAIAGRATFRGSLYLTAPAVLILVLAFSRNSILGIVAAAAFALLVCWSIRAFIRVTLISVVVVAASVLLVAGAPVIAQLPGGAWLNTQVESYTTRVVEGLNPSTQATDPSAQFREVSENQRIIPRIAESPVIGHGFGFAYKAATGSPGTFERELAYLYAHNFYLWLAVKTGLLGVAIFLLFIAWPGARSFRERSSLNIALTAGVVALGTISIVAPMGNGSPTSALLGALIGGVVGMAVTNPDHGSFELVRRRTRRSAHSPQSPQPQSQ